MDYLPSEGTSFVYSPQSSTIFTEYYVKETLNYTYDT